MCYQHAKDVYASFGVDTETAIHRLSQIKLSMHCWQGDDVAGFENTDHTLSGGLAATGNYIGKAVTANQLRADMDKAFSLIPGKHRISLHAIYSEAEGPVSRDEITFDQFANWTAWAMENGYGIDFNPTLFSHPMAKDGFTLSHPDKSIRDFWIRHCIACREIANKIGQTLNDTVINNIWIPDGFKDTPIDRLTPRRHLAQSLDQILERPTPYNLDALESKLFGIGSESCVVGSHEFYMGYAIKNQTLITLDTGHFHPTEMVSNKISGICDFVPGILLHVSRPVRWDSDHVVTLDDELQLLFKEIIGNDLLDKTYIGQDYFDASINRIAAWVIGMRNTQKALLMALLTPYDKLTAAEQNMDYTYRLALLEELKSLPWNIVWDEFLKRHDLPAGFAWYDEIKQYEQTVLCKR